MGIRDWLKRFFGTYPSADVARGYWELQASMKGCRCPFPSPGMMHFLECPLNAQPGAIKDLP